MPIIAGHSMEESHRGLACNVCDVRFIDIAGVQKSDIGKVGFCHQGALNQTEFDSIIAHRDYIWSCLTSVASGRGIGGVLPGSETEMEGFQ